MVTKKTTETLVEAWDESNFSFTHVLLVIVVLLNVVGLYLLTGNSLSLPGSASIDPVGIKKAILEVEYDKAGGKENFDILTKAQQLSMTDPQNPSNLEAMKTYIASFGSGGTPAANQPAPSNTNTSLDAEKIQAIIADAAIEGNKDADIVVIEYSDTECPFCVKQYQETKLWEKLQAQYGDKVKFAFKNNRGVNHPGTEAKAIGALCAQKVGGDEAYVSFYNTVMKGSSNDTGVYSVEKLGDAARTAWVDLGKWQACVDNKDTLTQFTAQTNEAQGLGLGGTPGTLILNVKTGKYSTVEGAYPYASFTEKIDSLMN
jgi:protein-disulfide isomerase